MRRASAFERWRSGLLAGLTAAAGLGLAGVLAAAAAVLVDPGLFAALRPWWSLLGAAGLLSVLWLGWVLWWR